MLCQSEKHCFNRKLDVNIFVPELLNYLSIWKRKLKLINYSKTFKRKLEIIKVYIYAN